MYLSDKSVQILPQYNTYNPQMITYNMVGDKFNKHLIHVILTRINTLHGKHKAFYYPN